MCVANLWRALLVLTAVGVSWAPARRVTRRDGWSELCRDPTVDAVFNTMDGSVYIFKGEWYYRILQSGVANGYPRLISRTWRGLPGNIDAAFTYQSGKTFFFKDDQYWRFENTKMDAGYPRLISDDFNGVPDNLDAAMMWDGNSIIYFFKGSSFWNYDPSRIPPLRSEHPEHISWWGRLPAGLDAAFACQGVTYFIKGHLYYRLNDSAFLAGESKVSNPRPTTDLWFGCLNNCSQTTVPSTAVTTTSVSPRPTRGPRPFRTTTPRPTRPPRPTRVPRPIRTTTPATTIPPRPTRPPRPTHSTITTPAPHTTPDVIIQSATMEATELPHSSGLTETNTALCEDPAIHATFRSPEGDTYVFKDSLYYKLSDALGLEPGYPQPVSRKWYGLPTPVDAACYHAGKTYFFKGELCWRYDDSTLDRGFPNRISRMFPGIPGDIDAAMEWSVNRKLYFFKGNMVWKFDSLQQPPVSPDYPMQISSWPGIPPYLDAVFSRGGYSYFFKERSYYRFHDSSFAVEKSNPTYPRPTGEWMFGCPDRSYNPEDITNLIMNLVKETDSTTTTTTTTTPSTTTSATTTTITTTTTTTPRPRREHPPELCDRHRVDTVLVAKDNMYVFKGHMYFKLRARQRGRPLTLERGFPRPVSVTWPGLPDWLDASFVYRDGKTYFFSGNKCWRYTGNRLDKNFPKEIEQVFPGIPNNLDTAMVWGQAGKIYFFKGNEFWKFDPQQSPSVDPMYPKLIVNWAGIPNYLDAAFVHQDHTYFFKHDRYYRFHDEDFAVDLGNPPYPRSLRTWWFGCPSDAE